MLPRLNLNLSTKIGHTNRKPLLEEGLTPTKAKGIIFLWGLTDMDMKVLGSLLRELMTMVIISLRKKTLPYTVYNGGW